MATTSKNIQEVTINTIRTLAMDGVEAAGSGHPGTPMALAPVAYELWSNVLRYDPGSPTWPNRDRYVLSCGHASMLLYSLIHIAQVKDLDAEGRPTAGPALSLDELRNFRQLGSRTAGHPEFGHAPGIETTTGPLGQGCGNSVGMAIAGKWLASRYNKPGFELFDYNVYAQCSDGDLMEGVAAEAASLAGHLQLSNLCWIYDDNRITIEGETDLAFSEDVPTRFRGLGWQVVEVDDANDLTAVAAALESFLQRDEGPTLIVVKSIIAYGAPNKQNTAGAHGAPLGDDEIKLAKAAYGWPADEKFLVPADVLEHMQETLGQRGQQARQEWEAQWESYGQDHPDLARELEQMLARELPAGWDEGLAHYAEDAKGAATRSSGGSALNAVAGRVPWLLGGSADLAPSTKTLITDAAESDFAAGNYGGRNLRFGIREHGMAAAANGMALCGLRPYAATFFVFSDYLRPSLRLSAIMNLPVIYVFTHDSIGVGEDGPTHQPIEHLAAVRAIPGVVLIRPADANEATQAWRAAMSETSRPTALVLTRQNLPTICREKYGPAEGLLRGGYVLADAPSGQPQVVLMASGSEVEIALEAHAALVADGVEARLVSVPSMELFDEQPQSYRDQVLPPQVTARVAVEAGIRQCWDRYLGSQGRFVGLDDFGASGKYKDVYRDRGLTADSVQSAAREVI